LAGVVLFGRWALASFLIYPLQILRQATRNRGWLRDRMRLAVFQMLARFAELNGQLRFLRDLALARLAKIGEYKRPGRA
jgi:hypothetical protein